MNRRKRDDPIEKKELDLFLPDEIGPKI